MSRSAKKSAILHPPSMKFKLNDVVITDLDGKVMKNESGKDLTVGFACSNALLSYYPNEKPEPGTDQKLLRFMLAKKIHDDQTVDLKTEDISLIKKLVGDLYFPTVVGAVVEAFEHPVLDTGKDKKK